jgi:tripartite-type tricarboxylate transporter receptor subunit TctC
VKSAVTTRIIAACALLCAPYCVLSQTYPTKPVRLVVGWPPGGAADGVARPLALKLSEALGQPVVVENRPGATGTIGATLVAKSPADGYTLLHGSSNEPVLSPYEKMPYDPVDDFAPVSTVISFPSVLVVHPSLPVKSMQELIAFMRARPGKLNFATTGLGTSHLVGEMFKLRTGVSFSYVAYKGGGPAIIDLIGGHVEAAFATLPSAVTYTKNGKLRGLMVTDRKRSATAPDIPAANEVKLPDMVALTWNGVLAPKGTPTIILDRLQRDVVTVMNTPDMKERMLLHASEVTTTSREAFAKMIVDDLALWSKLIKASNLRPGA